MPNVIIKPKRDIKFNVNPAAYIIATAANIAAGIPAATQKAVRADKNKNNKPITNPKPISPFWISILKRS